MSTWLLSIVGVVSLGVLIEIIMPEGEHSKYIKGIFSLVVVFVIISPFPKLIKGESTSDFFSSESVQISQDEDSYEAIKNNYRKKVENGFDSILEEYGFEDLQFTIEYDERYILKATTVKFNNTDNYNESDFDRIKQLTEGYFGTIKIEKGV